MEAKTLNCPMCGAAARSDAAQCEHCGARLATVGCPSCFGLMFRGAKFCPNCGAAAQRVELDSTGNEPCPRCSEILQWVDVGGTKLRECGKCEGLWVDNGTFEQICRAREKQTVFMGIPSLHEPQAATTIDPVRYLKCPTCRTLMNRLNFAGCSGVIVDVCKAHGTWFDCAELRRIIDFIQAGGMDKAREREIRTLAEERRVRSAERSTGSGAADMTPAGSWQDTGCYVDVLGCIAELAAGLLSDSH